MTGKNKNIAKLVRDPQYVDQCIRADAEDAYMENYARTGSVAAACRAANRAAKETMRHFLAQARDPGQEV